MSDGLNSSLGKREDYVLICSFICLYEYVGLTLLKHTSQYNEKRGENFLPPLFRSKDLSLDQIQLMNIHFFNSHQLCWD